LRGTHFEVDNSVIEAVRKWLCSRTRADTGKEYMHLFHAGIRPYKLMETM
jgi:hypothetical protein